MKAMRLRKLATVARETPSLSCEDVAIADPGPGEIRLRVLACGVCHTELDEIEGRLTPPRLPVIPGHQVVGRVEAVGSAVQESLIGSRVGVGWIYHACGHCSYCDDSRENLCADFRGTGCDVDGGYAEAMCVPADFAVPIPGQLSDVAAAPWLCAGAIGYRALRLAKLRDGEPLGLAGFGASAHLVLLLARQMLPSSPVFVFARHPDTREFALQQGADWAGDHGDRAPAPAQAIIDTTPVWTTVVQSLAALAPGGRLVINAIRKQDDDIDALTRLNYQQHLWMERQLCSVANVTRNDLREVLAIAAAGNLRAAVTTYPLSEANAALADLKFTPSRGAKVLLPQDPPR